MTKLEKRAIDTLLAWLKVGIYRGGTPEEGALLDAAVSLEATRAGKTERQIMDAVLAVPSPLQQHRARVAEIDATCDECEAQGCTQYLPCPAHR